MRSETPTTDERPGKSLTAAAVVTLGVLGVLIHAHLAFTMGMGAFDPDVWNAYARFAAIPGYAVLPLSLAAVGLALWTALRDRPWRWFTLAVALALAAPLTHVVGIAVLTS